MILTFIKNPLIRKDWQKVTKAVNSLFIVILLTSFAYGQPSPVKVEQGMLQGVAEGGIIIYKGIPFAAPPVGDLRWRAPQPPSLWKGVRICNKFAAAPIQAGDSPSGKSEDCLYLNIWAPAKSPGEKIPVLVWIYGGAFNAGATSYPWYSGEMLARKGVIVVSIAYRVGQLGFMAHPDLSKENPNHVSGNYGLLDMIAGLKWIQKNITAFGGDPDKVTIFGESAGGIAVSMLCASPLAKGLFQGAISESGGSFGPPRHVTFPGENLKRLNDAEAMGESYMTDAGFHSIADMRKLDANKLPPIHGLAWPIIDGWVILDDQYKLYEAGKYNQIPVLIGYNSDEGASFLPPKTPADYKSALSIRYGKFTDKLYKAYPAGIDSVPKTARDLTRDAAFGWPTWSWARLQSKNGRSNVFYYYFDRHPDYPKSSGRAGYGSPHAQEVAYVFGHLNSADPQTTAIDMKISDAMSTYWTNFAKYGNPNGEGLPNWPSFSEADPEVMYFDEKPHTGPVPSEQSLKILDEYFKWRRSHQGEAWANNTN